MYGNGAGTGIQQVHVEFLRAVPGMAVHITAEFLTAISTRLTVHATAMVSGLYVPTLSISCPNNQAMQCK